MTIKQLIQNWHPDDQKLFRDFYRQSGFDRQKWYREIANELHLCQFDSITTFATFIGCPLEDLTDVVKIDLVKSYSEDNRGTYGVSVVYTESTGTYWGANMVVSLESDFIREIHQSFTLNLRPANPDLVRP